MPPTVGGGRWGEWGGVYGLNAARGRGGGGYTPRLHAGLCPRPPPHPSTAGTTPPRRLLLRLLLPSASGAGARLPHRPPSSSSSPTLSHPDASHSGSTVGGGGGSSLAAGPSLRGARTPRASRLARQREKNKKGPPAVQKGGCGERRAGGVRRVLGPAGSKPLTKAARPATVCGTTAHRRPVPPERAPPATVKAPTAADPLPVDVLRG